VQRRFPLEHRAALGIRHELRQQPLDHDAARLRRRVDGTCKIYLGRSPDREAGI
jgi:hypothetical protein